jgi:hypothetical protein
LTNAAQVKPRPDTLPIWCPDCQRTTYQPIPKLQARICICSGCGKAIEMTPEILAAISSDRSDRVSSDDLDRG